MGIAVMPGLLMAIVTTGRDELVENLRHIAFEAGLELNGADGASGANVEDVGNADLDQGLAYDVCHFVGDVLHVTVSSSGDNDFVLISHSS